MMISKNKLLDIVAFCNNIIMKGSFSGDNVTEAAACMQLLQDLHEDLLEEINGENQSITPSES